MTRKVNRSTFEAWLTIFAITPHQLGAKLSASVWPRDGDQGIYMYAPVRPTDWMAPWVAFETSKASRDHLRQYEMGIARNSSCMATLRATASVPNCMDEYYSISLEQHGESGTNADKTPKTNPLILFRVSPGRSLGRSAYPRMCTTAFDRDSISGLSSPSLIRTALGYEKTS